MPTITRKIQLLFDVKEKSELKPLYEKWYKWQRIVHKSANQIATHLYLHDNIKEFFYLTDETKVKLTSVRKDIEGILMCSRDNTTYQVLSKLWKSECPMGMLAGLNMLIAKTYKKESKDILLGKRSLRTW